MLKHSDGSSAFSGLRPGKDGKLPKMSDAPRAPKADPVNGDGDKHEDVEKSELHAHPDGVQFKTVKGGAEENHPDLGHALMALAGHHKPEGKHVHAHHDGISVHTHGISDGQHDGPNEHGTPEEATDHMGSYLSDGSEDGDEHESGDDGDQDHEGLSGFGG